MTICKNKRGISYRGFPFKKIVKMRKIKQYLRNFILSNTSVMIFYFVTKYFIGFKELNSTHLSILVTAVFMSLHYNSFFSSQIKKKIDNY
jgi:hypothetical protein